MPTPTATVLPQTRRYNRSVAGQKTASEPAIPAELFKEKLRPEGHQETEHKEKMPDSLPASLESRIPKGSPAP